MRMLLVLVATVWATNCTLATDWLTLPSTYSHDPVSGRRVTQYAPVAQPTVAVDLSYRSSGYTHMRSTITYGQSSDNYHRVEKWGDPVRPYGEWKYPYRPYSTPYPNWGAPYAGLGNQYGHHGGYGRGVGGPGYGGYPSPGTLPASGNPNFGGPQSPHRLHSGVGPRTR